MFINFKVATHLIKITLLKLENLSVCVLRELINYLIPNLSINYEVSHNVDVTAKLCFK